MKIITSIFLFVFIAQSIFGQSKEIIKKNASAAYVAPNGASKSSFEISSGAYFFDATKRMGISNIVLQADSSYHFKYLSEEQPDAIYETIKDFLLKQVQT